MENGKPEDRELVFEDSSQLQERMDYKLALLRMVDRINQASLGYMHKDVNGWTNDPRQGFIYSVATLEAMLKPYLDSLFLERKREITAALVLEIEEIRINSKLNEIDREIIRIGAKAESAREQYAALMELMARRGLLLARMETDEI